MNRARTVLADAGLIGIAALDAAVARGAVDHQQGRVRVRKANLPQQLVYS